jgi:transcription-repair coupling factor (superfamily II helicase)
LPLLDSQQLRLKRLYPSAHYRATTSTVQVPIPRAGDGVAAPRIRDLELVRMVAGLVLALDGKPQESVDITKSGSGQRPVGGHTR